MFGHKFKMRQSSLNKGCFVFYYSGNGRQICLQQRWALHLAISHLWNTNNSQHLISLLGRLGWTANDLLPDDKEMLLNFPSWGTTCICRCSLATRSSQAEGWGNYFLHAGNSHFRAYAWQVHLQKRCAAWREAGGAPQCWSTSAPEIVWQKGLPSLESREWRLQPNPHT